MILNLIFECNTKVYGFNMTLHCASLEVDGVPITGRHSHLTAAGGPRVACATVGAGVVIRLCQLVTIEVDRDVVLIPFEQPGPQAIGHPPDSRHRYSELP